MNNNEGEVSQDTLDTIEAVVRPLARKFIFGCYTVEDLEQFGRMECLKALPSYDGIRPLRSFLYCHVNNRLKNLRRNKLYRITPPCGLCAGKLEGETGHADRAICRKYRNWLVRNRNKRNIMEAKQLSVLPVDFNSGQNGTEAVEIADAVNVIENKLRIVGLYEDFIAIKLGGAKAVTKSTLDKIILIIEGQLCQMDVRADLRRLINRL